MYFLDREGVILEEINLISIGRFKENLKNFLLICSDLIPDPVGLNCRLVGKNLFSLKQINLDQLKVVWALWTKVY